jgi:methyl-accepting chemotaxis protein
MNLSLGNRFLLPTTLIVVLGTCATSLVSYRAAGQALDDSIRKQLAQHARFVGEQIEVWISRTQLDVFNWSQDRNYQAAIQDTFMGRAMRRTASEQLSKNKEQYRFYEGLHLADAKGDIVASSDPDAVGRVNTADRSYFRDSMAGKTVMSDIMESRVTGRPVLVVSSPIPGGDSVSGVFIGVVDVDYLSRLFIDSVAIGQTGHSYLFDHRGTVIAHPVKTKILREKITDFEFGRRMAASSEGTLRYEYDRVRRIAGFKRSEKTGWTVAVAASESDILSPVRNMGLVGLAIASVVLLITAFAILWIARSVTIPVNRIVGGLTEVADRVSEGSNQVATSSNQLAQGGAEQAASLEETSASLEQMAAMTKQNASHADDAKKMMDEASSVIDRVNVQIEEMADAVHEIARTSDETGKIVKTIEEIAFQTNLLALNAAVEAARAGESGAGFAIVAEEVRSLALRAGAAAKNTAALIEGTIRAVREGNRLTQSTREAYKENIVIGKKVAERIGEIAAASSDQARGVGEINRTVAEMGRVVQSMASSSEESAAAAQEMDAQSNLMKAHVRDLRALVGTKSAEIRPVVEPMSAGTRIAEPRPNIKPADGRRSGKNRAIQQIEASAGAKAKHASGRTVASRDIIPLEDDFEDF